MFPIARVFFIGLVVLFLENALIRWLPSQVRALSYFQNLTLLSSFLGMGLGALLAGRARWLLASFPILFGLEILLAVVLSGFVVSSFSHGDEHLWLLYFDLPRDAPHFPLWLAIVLTFVVNTATWAPLGQWVAEALRAPGRPVLAYAANLAGSLVGTIAFVGLSFAEAGPRLWFALALGAMALAVWPRKVVAALAAAAAIACALAPIDNHETWSPYYALSRTRPNATDKRTLGDNAATAGDGFYLAVNGSFHQAAADLSAEGAQRSRALGELRTAYRAPYEILRDRGGKTPKEVLIIGAGTGNDVRVALESGATRVDAVEIDPVIARFGKDHPNKPYDDPRVRLYIDDARSFLQRPPRKYDLIVFGTLDSQTALSALSTIRLDNYVYTRESLEAARDALKPDGGLALYFWVAEPWLRVRLLELVRASFGHAPFAYQPSKPRLFNLVLVTTRTPVPALVPELPKAAGETLLPTDDWPFLYHREMTLSPFYAMLLGIIALLASGAVLLALRGSRRPVDTGGLTRRFHVPLFLQGAAFMLLETKSIASASLVFGSTWVVNAFVIGGILLVMLGANLAVHFKLVRRIDWIMAGLAATLLAGYFVGPADLALDAPAARLAVAALVLLSPIFFSSLLFGVLFDRAEDTGAAYASSLLGSVLGGLTEFFSVMTGFRALGLVALALYLGAYALARRHARATARTARPDAL